MYLRLRPIAPMRSITSRAFEPIPCISNACTLECAQRSQRQPVHAGGARRSTLPLSLALCHRCSRATSEQALLVRASCLARTIAAQILRRRIAQMRAPHSLPDSASMPIAWREVEGSDLRPRLPSWRLVWLTQVWCVPLSVRLGCYQPVHGPIESCMECEHGMRVPSSPRVGRECSKKFLLGISPISRSKHPGLVERSPKMPFSSLQAEY